MRGFFSGVLTLSLVAASASAGPLDPRFRDEAMGEVVDPIVGQPKIDPSRWHMVANHTHSSTGIGKYKRKGLKKIFELAKRKGFKMVIITDHNTLGHWYDPLFVETDGVIPVKGMEWTSDDGHANVFDFSSDSPADVLVPCDYEEAPAPCGRDGINYAEMIEEVQGRNGLVIINHPRLKRHIWPEDSFGADAVEVNRNLTDVNGTSGRRWWHRRLSEGQKVTAMGGSDWHYWRPFSGEDPEDEQHGCVLEEEKVIRAWPKPSFDDAVNLVRMETPSVQALRDAVKAGHIQVLKKPKSPRIYMGADANGDGSFGEVRAGDTVPSGGESITIQLRIFGADGDDMRVYFSYANASGDRIDTVRNIEVSGNDAVIAIKYPKGRPGESFVRAEIGKDGEVVTNPIFF